MGDVAQILGVQNSKKRPLAPGPAPSSHSIPKAIQNSSTVLSKPVLKLLAGKSESQNYAPSSSLPPIVPSHNLPLTTHKRNDANATPSNTNNQISYVKINNKLISTKKARSWIYAPFTNSARKKDELQLHHWVRAGVEYPEYPYARFDVHLEELSYREEVLAEMESNNVNVASGNVNRSGNSANNASHKSEEEINAACAVFYQQYLHAPNWTQSETDTLLELCRVYQLRWPVIIDRWMGVFGSLTSKKVEDLQHRYYTIGYILNRMKVERAAKVEADHLAKAMAAASQNLPTTSTALPGSGGITGVATTPAPALLHDASTNQEQLNLQTQSTLLSAITSAPTNTTSSPSINNILSNVQTSVQPPLPVTKTGTSNQPTFDLDSERERRKVLEVIWARTKEEEMEEMELKKELKLVEMQLRKLKKSGGHILAANKSKNSFIKNEVIDIDSAASSRANSTTPTTGSNLTTSTTTSIPNTTITETSNTNIFATTAPTPTPGTPYLQSGRLKPPPTSGPTSIPKSTLTRIDQILSELNIDKPPLPTKRNCDLYDLVRKHAYMLLTLEKQVLKSESEVVTRRRRLDVMAGNVAKAQEVV